MDADRETPPDDVSLPVKALWWDARDDWHRAHKLVADDTSQQAAWVHAYLHRREGDLGNAGYWYTRARKPICSLPLDEERLAILAALQGAP